jgi:hypothetical protein
MEVNQQDFTSSNCVTGPVISDRISTPSGEDLNNQSFLRLMAKVNEKNLIVLENERLANELSLVQSQLTDSHSKLRQFDIELATTKSELEEKKSLITDMIEKNLRLANDDSRLRRKIEDRDRIIESSAIEKNLILLENECLVNELSLLQSQLTDSSSKLQMFQNVHDELATTKSELEKQKSVNTDITEINRRLKNDNSRLKRKIKDRDRLIASSRAIALKPSAPHWTYFQEDLGVPLQFTPINRTLFEPTKFHGDLLGLHHNSNTAEFVRPVVKAKDVLRYKATEEVGMTYLSDDKNPNELYPFSLLQEVRSNQKSQMKLLNQPRFLESFHSDKPDLAVEDLETDDQFSHILEPEDSQVLQHYPEKSDLMFENKDNQHQHLLEEDAHPMPQNRRKSDCVKKGDNQPRHIPENQHITLPPNPEKSDLLEKKVNQTQVKPKDPHELDHNEEKYDLLEKKFNNKLLELNNQMLELNNKINFLLTPKDPHALPQNPTEKSDLLGEKENEPQTKPEDPQVLGNPKVEQERETDKKQSIGQNIKKSLLSVKELFQPRKQTELENNLAEKNGLKNEPDVEKSREKCVINGKTFPLIFDDAFVKSVADYNVWESIGKPKIINTEKWGKFENEGVSIIGETKVNIVVNGKKKKIKILVINKPLEYHSNTVFISKSDLP